MKNWIIALAVIILPIATFFVLEKTNATTATEAVAQNTFSLPTIIKFASPMCLDCKKLDATMSEIMPAYENKVDYKKIDVQAKDTNTTNMIKKYNVTLVPTLVLIKKDGTVYKQVEGYFNKNDLKSMFDALLKQ